MVAKETASSGTGRQTLKSKAPATAAAGGRSAKPVASRGSGAGDRVARRVNAPSLGQFFQESRSELMKVTWPTRQDTLNLTGAVIAMTVGLAAFLGLVDEIVTVIIKPILGTH